MSTPLSLILVALFLLAGSLLWQRSKQPQKDFPLPPGPKRWPLIGSLLQMPKVFEHETYSKWSRQYGNSFLLYDSLRLSLINFYEGSDIIYTNVLGQSIIIIDKYETAIELLDKRSGSYSSKCVSVTSYFCRRHRG
jgi:hypothetical protein